MAEKYLNQETKTGRIHIQIFKLLDENPNGMQWVELAKEVQKTDKTIHPKTLNGCIWKLAETFPNRIHKPARGLFQLIKYKK